MMNGLDLFSGGGGITKALEGYVEPVAYCEIDPYCQGSLLSRMHSDQLPYAPIWDDIRTLRRDDLPMAPEIIYGGPPCQPFSSAGKRIGKSDPRNLWPEALRVVEEFRPEHCFFENSDELGADPYFIEIVERLEALGYFVPWPIILAASDVGAPHQRDRIWIAAHLKGESMGVARQPRINGGMGKAPDAHCQRRAEARELQRNGPEERSRRSRQAMADSAGIRRRKGRTESAGIKGRYYGTAGDLQASDLDTSGLPLFQGLRAPPQAHGGSEFDSDDWWATEPDVGRVVHGIPFRVERISLLGNSVVPRAAREAFERLMGLK